MQLNDLQSKLKLTNYNSSADLSEEIDGVYIGDLLSWVMGRANPGSIWITIMSNVNVAAVASLAGTSCVIMAEGVKPDPDCVEKIVQENLAVFGSELSSYQLAVAIAKLLSED